MRHRALRKRYGRSRSKTIEGVRHTPFRVSFVAGGKRRSVTLWSPGQPWLRSEVTAMLDARGDVDTSKPVTVRPA